MPIHSSTPLRRTDAGGVSVDPEKLVTLGPVLECELRVDVARGQSLREAGQPVPVGTRGKMLVDTGASITCIEVTALEALGIPSIGDCVVHTPGGQAKQNVYPCGLAFPGTTFPSVPSVFVLGADLKAQGFIGLMGRDLLQNCVLVYNGPSGAWSIAI